MTPEGWESRPLAALADINMGQAPASAVVHEGLEHGIPFLQGNSEFGTRYPEPRKSCSAPTRLSERGDLLISVRAPVGALNRSDRQFAIGRGLASIRPRLMSNDFVWYALQYRVIDLARLSQGSTFEAINKDALGTLVVPFPRHLPEQRKIAAILSSMDDAIESTQAVIDQLRVVKRAMMAELLTRGLPGRHTRFKQTEIGEVPEGWDVVRLGELSSYVTSGSRGWAQYYADEGPLFIRITNLERGTTRLDLRDRQHVHLPAGSSEGVRTRVAGGDILISITADLGIVGLVPLDGFGEAYVNQHIALVRLDQSRADPRYVANVLAGSIGELQVRRFNDGGAKAGLNLPNVRQLQVPLPNVIEQRALVESVEQIEDRLVVERDTIEALRGVKSALMSVLLTGELRVTPDEPAP